MSLQIVLNYFQFGPVVQGGCLFKIVLIESSVGYLGWQHEIVKAFF